MPKDVEDKLVWGILEEDSQTFYYIESGLPRVAPSLDRLRTILIQREIISMVGTLHNKHKIMQYSEAKRLGYKLEPVFTSAHVRQVWEQEQQKKTAPKNGW